MAVIGYLGTSAEEGIMFETSSEKTETPENVAWSGSSRYAVHQRHNTHALTEFTGLEPDKISFDMTLAADLGAYGKYRWVIKDLKIKGQYFDVHGNQYCTRVSVNLLEYLNQDF